MDATLILIDSDAELLRARALVDQLWNSTHPADLAAWKRKRAWLPRTSK
jgi:hypothetical protein